MLQMFIILTAGCGLLFKSGHKKAWIYAVTVVFILFFQTLSFAQYEDIKGVKFKDGSITYGKVIKMNADGIQIETNDGKIISSNFGEVDNFIKINDLQGLRLKNGDTIHGVIIEMNVDKVVMVTKDNNTVNRKSDDIASLISKYDTEEDQGKQEIFRIAFGAERMSGHTTYQIGYPWTAPDGTRQEGYFPFSQLEWPLDVWLARIDTKLHIGKSWRITGILKKNFSNPHSNMKDSDWETDSNPERLDIYSESSISKFDAWIFDADVEWLFLKKQSWSLHAGLGYQYQKFNYEAKLIHQYSPSGLSGNEYFGDGRVGITYDITYKMPYMKIGADFKIKDNFTLDGSFSWSPLVKAKDEDHHLLRENGGKICTGDMDGYAVMINASAKYNFTPSWFLKGGFNYTGIHVSGDQNQVYGNGMQLGTVKEESDSTQISGYLTVGYTF